MGRQPLSKLVIASGLSFNLDYGQFNEKEAKRGLRQIVDTTQHLSQTIDDFRNFYKIGKSEKTFNLAKNIEQSITITEASLSENYIKVIKNLNKKKKSNKKNIERQKKLKK